MLTPGNYNNITINRAGQIIGGGNAGYALESDHIFEGGQLNYFYSGDGTTLNIDTQSDGTNHFVKVGPVTDLSNEVNFDPNSFFIEYLLLQPNGHDKIFF